MPGHASIGRCTSEDYGIQWHLSGSVCLDIRESADTAGPGLGFGHLVILRMSWHTQDVRCHKFHVFMWMFVHVPNVGTYVTRQMSGGEALLVLCIAG